MRTLNELQLGILISLGRTVAEANASEDSPEWDLIRKIEHEASIPVREHPCSVYYIDEVKCQGRFEVCQVDPELSDADGQVCGEVWIAVNSGLRDALTDENVKALVGLVMAEAQKIQAATGGPEPRLLGLRKYESWTESTFSQLPLPA